VNGASEVYSSQYLYLQTDGSTGPGFARPSGTSIPVTTNFELLEYRALIGAVQLPADAIANMPIWISVEALDEKDGFVTFQSDEIVIESGSNSSPFSVRYGPAPSNGFYRVSIACLDNCEYFPSETIYLKSANKCGLNRTLIQAALMPRKSSIDLAVCFSDSDFIMPPVMLLLGE
jgi:hypothetical protein